MVDGSSDERQPERDVHATAEARVLQHRQSLVVIHGEHAIGLAQPLGHEQRIGGNRPLGVDAAGDRSGDRGRDHLHVFASQVTRLPAMRIEPRDEDARARDPEAALQVGIDHPQGARHTVGGDGARHLGKGQMRGGERDAQAAADQHHHDRRAAGLLGEIFGVAGEGDAGVVDHALLHRRGHHGGELALEAAADGAVENRQHIASVCRIEPAGNRRTRERHVLDARTAGEERAVADDHDVHLRSKAYAQLGTDAGGLAGSERDYRLASQPIFPQAATRRRSGRAAGAAIPGRPRRPCARAAPGAPACGGARD